MRRAGLCPARCWIQANSASAARFLVLGRRVGGTGHALNLPLGSGGTSMCLHGPVPPPADPSIGRRLPWEKPVCRPLVETNACCVGLRWTRMACHYATGSPRAVGLVPKQPPWNRPRPVTHDNRTKPHVGQWPTSACPLATGQLSKGRPVSVCGGLGAMDGVRVAPMDGFTATPQTGTGRPKPGKRCTCGCSPESNSSRAQPRRSRNDASNR